jgi:hypothetical protein
LPYSGILVALATAGEFITSESERRRCTKDLETEMRMKFGRTYIFNKDWNSMEWPSHSSLLSLLIEVVGNLESIWIGFYNSFQIRVDGLYSIQTELRIVYCCESM